MMSVQETEDSRQYHGWKYPLGLGVFLFLILCFTVISAGITHGEGENSPEKNTPETQPSPQLADFIHSTDSAQKNADAPKSTDILKKASVQKNAQKNIPVKNSVPFSELVSTLSGLHPWWEFEPGSWRFSRTIIQNRQRGGNPGKTYIETNVILHEKSGKALSTVTESYVLLAGKSIKKEPKTTGMDAYGLPPEDPRTIEELPGETLEIEGQSVPCRVLKVISEGKNIRRESRVWFSETCAPYLLRRERKTYRLPENSCCESLVQHVTTRNLQLSVLGKVLTGFIYSQESRFETYISRSEIVASLSIPGHIVTQITHETTLNGCPLQDISTQLLDYGLSNSDRQRGIYRTLGRGGRMVVSPRNGRALRPRILSVEFSAENEAEISTGNSTVNSTPTDSSTDLTPDSDRGPETERTEINVENDSAQNSKSVLRRENDAKFSEKEAGNTSEKTSDDEEMPSENKDSENETGISFPEPEGGFVFFERFQSRWSLGEVAFQPGKGAEISDIFPNLRPLCPEEWGLGTMLEAKTETEGNSRSPIYNQKLRMTRSRSSVEIQSFINFQQRVISTQSLRIQGHQAPKNAVQEEFQGPEPLEGPFRRTFRAWLYRTQE